MNSRNPPQVVGALTLGFKSRTKGNLHSEASPTKNIAPHPTIPNVVIMNEAIKDQMVLEGIL